MNAYGLFLTFDPDQVCASRKGLGGVWRVRSVFDLGDVSDRRLAPVTVHWPQLGGRRLRPRLLLASTRPYRRGVMVNPKKIALDFVRARHKEEAERRAVMRRLLHPVLPPYMLHTTETFKHD